MIIKIAHRGYLEEYPENTLAAFQAAIDHGANMIEMDLQLTADDKWIVHHDYHLRRTNNSPLDLSN